MMVIETPYVVPAWEYRNTSAGTTDLRFTWLDAWGRLNDISARMRACATSSEHFAMAGADDSIEAALRKMGELALKNYLRLTN